MATSSAALIQQKYSSHKLDRVSALIGGTPLYPLTHIYQKPGVQIFAKLEWQQLGGSVKSRPALQIIKHALTSGLLADGKRLLDATSGNTGIAYASIAASLSIPVTLCLPENASEERKRILLALGVEIIYTSKFDGTDGAQYVARSLASRFPDLYHYADQYANFANQDAHYKTTAPEIWQQTNGSITHFVAGLGTTGTFTGTGRKLKELNSTIELIALQPDNPMHGLEGWKHLETANVPKIFQSDLPDRTLEIDTIDAYDLIKKLAKMEGLLVSPSAAANLAGAIRVADQIDHGVVVTTFADSADKYAEVLKHIF